MKRKQDECKAWLLELLLIKHPHQVPATSIFAAGLTAGFAESTVRRTKRKLPAIRSFNRQGRWYWYVRKNYLLDSERVDRNVVQSNLPRAIHSKNGQQTASPAILEGV